MSRVDWPALRAAAVEIMRRAYAPYSKFPVGAAGLVDDGRVVLGCNVENAAYGVVLCAECGMVSQLHATGGGRLIAMACVDADGEPLLPCGRCRQLLWENGGAAMLVDSKVGALTMEYLLPHGFGREDLEAIATPSSEPAFFEPDSDDDRPKRPPSRSTKRKAPDPAEPEQPKARAAKKLTLRDAGLEASGAAEGAGRQGKAAGRKAAPREVAAAQEETAERKGRASGGRARGKGAAR
jgi:cytidine deaminase